MPFSKNAEAFEVHATNSSVSNGSSFARSQSEKPLAKQAATLRASGLLARKYAVFAVCALVGLALFLMYLRKRKQRTEATRKMQLSPEKEEDTYEGHEPLIAAPSHGSVFRNHGPPLPPQQQQQQPPLPQRAAPGRHQQLQRQTNAGSTVALTPAELKGAPISVNESERVVERAA